MLNKKHKDSELQGINRLLVDATIEVTDLVEEMHRRIVHPPFLPSTPIQHLITTIAGVAYKNIRWSTKFIGKGADMALGSLASVMGNIKKTEEREVMRSVLNGLIGDHLEKTDNPLKIDMQFRHYGKAFQMDSKNIAEAYPTINGKILLMVHGSCTNDIQWTRKEHNHGVALAKEFDKTPISLYYNSGRHISSNGQNLNTLLEKLVLHWPVAVEELIIISHSMGGLVARSALHYGQQQQNSWTKNLKKMIFLGTPHHGASLEKAGNYVEVILKAIPYAKPFARLAKIRGAGVTDLRYGNLLDKDWQDMDQHSIQGDRRQHVPLPEQIACYTIAAVAGKETASKTKKMLGDNLVSIKSALGKHKNPTKNLDFKKKHSFIAYENTHLDLLSDAKVYNKIKTWMAL